LPPICRMRPGRYIAVVENQPPVYAELNFVSSVIEPVPVGSTQYIWPLLG